MGGSALKRIVLTGGGTAGHVTPNLALIPSLLSEGWDVHYVGTADGIERRLVEALPGVSYHAVSTGKLRRYFDLKNLTDPLKVVAGAGQSLMLLKKLRPNLVFAKGGFVSVPVVYGAAALRIPVLLHESDMTPGLANKLAMPFAKKLLCTFPEAAKLAGAKVDMPAVVYRELRAAYAYHSAGQGTSRSLAPDLVRLVGPTDIATTSLERT